VLCLCVSCPLSLPALENLHCCELGGDTQVRRERKGKVNANVAIRRTFNHSLPPSLPPFLPLSRIGPLRPPHDL